VFAYDNNTDKEIQTSILGRPKHGRSTVRNDNLAI